VATLAPPGFSDTGISPTPQDIASNPLATLQPTPTEFVEEDECVYTVQSGDTLFSIATSYGFFPEDFQAINPELAVNPNSLYIGQKLNIPECDDGTGTPSPSTDGEGDVATPTPEGNTAPPGSQTYIVQAGDTLFSIALRFNVTVDAIVAATDFLVSAETIIRPGDVLIIPPPE
jgi:LysM repeat protein